MRTPIPLMPVTLGRYVVRDALTLDTLRVTVCTPARSALQVEARFMSLGSRERFRDRLLHVLGGTAFVDPQRNASQSPIPESKTSPGSVALFGVMWPAPWLKMTVGEVGGPSSTSAPVVIKADLIIIGDQSGCSCSSSAAIPAT